MDGNTLHRQHPRPHSLAASWKSSDIELEYIVPPCTETASTRGLLVAPDSASAKTDVETGQPPPKSASGRTTISIHDTNHERTGFGRQAAPPDYKPVPLRWPFQVFLLVCIGGLMFFLEQVMRGLAGRIPPTLPSSPDELFDGDSAAPPARRALVTNRPASDRPSTSVAQLQARAQQITSTSAFPHSGEVTQYFGWEEPVVFQMCNDDGHLTVVTIVPPIYTSDPSWCPIFEDRSTNRGYTMDEPCEFIQDVLYRNETPLEGYDDLCRNQSGRPDHLVPQPWPLPVVVPEGIMMPLEISTSTDANGVPVTTTGYFHNVRTQTVITSTDCADGAVHTVTTSMPLPQTWRLLPGPRRVPNATSVSKYASAYMHGKFPYHEIALSFGDGQNLVTMLTWYDGRSSLPEHPLTSWGGFSPQSACPAGSTSLSTPTTATMETSQQSATSTPALVPIPVWIPPAPSTSMPPSTLSRSTMPSPSAISPTRKILIVSTSGLPSNESSARPSSGDTADSNENASNLGPSIGAGAATGDTISAATSPMPTPPPPPLPAVVVVVNGTTVTLPAPAAPTITTTVYEHGPLWSGPGTPEATYVTEGDFWLASVVPVLLSTLLSLVVGILSSSVKAMLPFRAMGRAEGAAAADSLCLRPNHFLWPLVSLRFLYRLRDPLPLLSDVLSLLATVLIPLSSEILRVEVYRNRLGIGLQRSTGPSRAAEALLAVMAAVIAALGLMLFRWRSGVPSYPWSMVAMASLLPARGETRRLLLSLPTPTDGTSIIPTSQVADLLSEHRFRLMYYRSDGSHHAEYGIGVTAPVDDTGSIRLTKRDRPKPREGKSRGGAGGGGLGAKLPQQLSLSSHMIESTLDAAFFLFLCSLLALLFYYENTSYDTSFERFLDSQKLGVRALFTTFGVAINLFWEYYLSRVAMLSFYRRLSHPQPSQESIELNQPATAFSALWQATTTGDYFLGAVSMATVVSKLTPMLLANVPFRNTVTWRMHETGTWGSIAALVYMVAVLGAGTLVAASRRPRLPLKPESLAACLYYVCDSSLLLSFDGVAALPRRRDRDRAVCDATRGNLYLFGKMRGLSGAERVGVDCIGRA